MDKLLEGGAMPGVGPIHISEIEPTLKKLEQILKIDLRNNLLGSAGKKQFSGDIDIALQIDPDDIPAFMERLKQSNAVEDISKSSVIMTKVKIQSYDESKQTDKPRTGYVQVDFMPGDPGWLKTYYHSPGETESKYKGVFRNLLLVHIAAILDNKASEEKIDDGRPVEEERWMFSPRDGLVRIKRTPTPKATGVGYTKKNNNQIIDGPYKTAEEIAEKLNLGSVEALNSYETLKKAIEKNYSNSLVKQILLAFKNDKTVRDVGVPKDIEKLGEGTEGSQDWFREILNHVILD